MVNLRATRGSRLTTNAYDDSRRHSPSWVLLHSLLIGFGLTSLLTGLRIATQTRPEILTFSAVLPQGYLHGLHFFSGAGLAALTGAYLLHLYLFREQRCQIRLGAPLYHRIVFWLGRLLVLVSLVSGCLLFFDVFTISAIAEIHYLAALTWLLYLFIHGGVYFVQHGWLSLKRIATAGPVSIARDGAILVTTIAVFGIAAGWIGRSAHHGFLVRHIPMQESIRIDGVADEAAWAQADSITLNTIGGANFENGQTPVTIKALHNGRGVFLHVAWNDPDKSLRHLPLVRTTTGWKVSESGFYQFDEMEHYEDKLALMFSQNCGFGAARTAHLGPAPLDDKPPNWHGKGYHYSPDSEVHDVWHWKAVRTNDMVLADDNLFGPPDVVRAGSRRYTAGYLADPKESGAYWMNWQWYRPDGIVPRRMPGDSGELSPFQAVQNQDQRWSIPWYAWDFYEAQNDNHPTGTMMPSVLYMTNRLEGDRADVYAHGIWADGQWSLELMRRIDTGSAWDVRLEDGVCLWAAAFDHAQITHTRHARPIRLVFEPDYD